MGTGQERREEGTDRMSIMPASAFCNIVFNST